MAKQPKQTQHRQTEQGRIHSALNGADTAELVAQMLTELAEKFQRLRQLQVANQAADGDPVPEPSPPGVQAEPYATRLKNLEEAYERLYGANADISDEVDAALDRMRRQRGQRREAPL